MNLPLENIEPKTYLRKNAVEKLLFLLGGELLKAIFDKVLALFNILAHFGKIMAVFDIETRI